MYQPLPHCNSNSEPLSEDIDSEWIMLQEINRKRFLFPERIENNDINSFMCGHENYQKPMSANGKNVCNCSRLSHNFHEHVLYHIAVPNSSNINSAMNSCNFETNTINKLEEREEHDLHNSLIHLEEPFNQEMNDSAAFESPLTLNYFNNYYNEYDAVKCDNEHELAINEVNNTNNKNNDTDNNSENEIYRYNHQNQFSREEKLHADDGFTSSSRTFSAPLLVPCQSESLTQCSNYCNDQYNAFTEKEITNLRECKVSSFPSVMSKSTVSHFSLGKTEEEACSESLCSPCNNQHKLLSFNEHRNVNIDNNILHNHACRRYHKCTNNFNNNFVQHEYVNNYKY